MNQEKCQCAICGNEIKSKTPRSAELSQTDDHYYAKGVPAGHESQGWFDIGSDCFKKQVIK